PPSAHLPGRFILPGSANARLLPPLADSLAGRMAVIRLRPLARCELPSEKRVFLQQLFQASFSTGKRKLQRLGEALPEIICQGGYPAASAARAELGRFDRIRV